VILNVMLKSSGHVVAIDEDGHKIDRLHKPWTEVLPKLLREGFEDYTIFWYFGDAPSRLTREAVQYLWLSICRDEDLIAKALNVIRTWHRCNVDGLDKAQMAINELEESLKQRGRIA
jgi:hypothetical protein